MADQNITAGIRGVEELTEARNEITRLRATISQERTKAAAAEARAAASEALQRSREAPAGIPLFGGPGAASKWDPTGAAYRSSQAQAAAMAAQYRTPIGPQPFQIPTFGTRGASSTWDPTGASMRNVQAKHDEIDQTVIGQVANAIDSITPMKAAVVGATVAIAGFAMAVSQATAAENARRARSMSANESLGMVGALPKDVESIINQGASGKGGSISPEDAQRITSLYGSSLASLGPAASAIGAGARAARLRELFKARRGGMSMSALSATISTNGSPFMDVGTASFLAGVPGQSSNLGITEAQDFAAQAANIAAAEGGRSPFRDAAFQASQSVALGNASGNILAGIPLATTALTAWNAAGSASVTNIGKNNRPDATGIGWGSSGIFSILSAIAGNTSPATKVPSPIEGRQ